jgi:hypothetical protein
VSFQFIVDDIKEVVVAVGKKTVVWWPSPDVQPLQCGVQRGRCRVELLGDIRSGFERRVLLGHRQPVSWVKGMAGAAASVIGKFLGF